MATQPRTIGPYVVIDSVSGRVLRPAFDDEIGPIFDADELGFFWKYGRMLRIVEATTAQLAAAAPDNHNDQFSSIINPPTA